MEVMEDGNLMDKVNILIQRDMEYYTKKQSVLQESICPGIVGGKLDFPRYASFAAVKLVIWWEDEYLAAFRKNSGFLRPVDENLDGSLDFAVGCGGVVRTSDPSKFIAAITKTYEQLLEHLHILTQEALDHADLTVLIATIGAASLLKNCLWSYMQSVGNSKSNYADQLQSGLKKYQEMAEALAERLLDLHCRLLSLYILQDAESLDWENGKPFFESERGSYVVQMWWLYMQGTREDLWNTVPPKMAQRVFSGMLNETLNILTVRYSQISPSECRSKLVVVDISNLLLCVAQLLPCICDDAEQLIGLYLNNQNKILRDIHSKCQELLTCFILRGAPLDVLHKVFRKGFENCELSKSRGNTLSPWIIFSLQNIFKETPKNVTKLTDLPDNTAIALEFLVLLNQPQPNWALLLKVCCMRNFNVLLAVLRESLSKFNGNRNWVGAKTDSVKCEGFLCTGDGICKSVEWKTAFIKDEQYFDIIYAVTHVFLIVGNEIDIAKSLLPIIRKVDKWGQCFDRREVWNQKRPPYFEAIIDLINPILPPITRTVINAVKTGASMYQAMSIVLACFSQLWDCINPIIPLISHLIHDLLPAEITPIGNSALLQLLLSALYTDLLRKSEAIEKKQVKFAKVQTQDEVAVATPSKNPLSHKNSICSFDGTGGTEDGIALAVAEALCSIDEDNKHTEQIQEFLEQAKQSLEDDLIENEGCGRVETTHQIIEILASDVLMSHYGKKSLKVLHHFLICNSEWIFQNLHVSPAGSSTEANRVNPVPNHLLHTMFHIGYKSFDQLLTGEWKPDWPTLLSTPMGLSSERVWGQVSNRWEFKDANFANLSASDAQIVTVLSSMLKPV
ncbi:hypothetical protein MML48_7g00003443 [Holotrichia oblita]|uniref:Uncharacterized protein n=1 Tax=Holotrichia oblita TaxID=644536 RepID=A0ACB9SSG1_HOLOL|nr:hypothetical protein MML48_7g00003443 [Holotrichia oblita]